MNIVQESLARKQLNKGNCIYIGVSCRDTEKAKQHFYSGDLLLQSQRGLSNAEFEELAERFFGSTTRLIFESLEETILEIFGGDNCHRVGNGFGKNEFHISFEFRVDGFWAGMEKLKSYFAYLELDDVMAFFSPESLDRNADRGEWVTFRDYKPDGAPLGQRVN